MRRWRGGWVLSNIKSEMEDLCMKYLYPKEFEELANAIELKREERMGFVNKIALT